jgi:hypothetical protein
MLHAKGETIDHVIVAPTNDESTLKEEQNTEKLPSTDGTVSIS